jgi:hypothetical protein
MEHYQPLAELIGFKGINADFIEEMLPSPDNPIYLTNGDNVIVQGGKICKLRGVNYLNNISIPVGPVGSRQVLGLPIFENFQNEKRLLAVTPTRASFLSNDDTMTDIGIVMAGTRDSVLSFANLNNTCAFVLSDDGTVYTWDGSSTTQLINPASLKSRFLIGFKTYLFLIRPIIVSPAGETEMFNTVWPSYPGVISTFEDEDRLTMSSSGPINGCRSLEETIIVYSNDSINRVYWVSETEGWGHYPVTDKDGLLAPKTLTGDISNHFYLGKSGVMRHVLGSVPVPLSWMKFNKFIIDGIDPLYYTRAISQYYPDTGLLYFAFPPAGTSENGTLLIYNTRDNELVGKKALTGLSYSCMGTFLKDLTGLSADERNSYGVGGIPIMGTTDGHVLEQKYNAYTELSAAYESSAVLPLMFFGDRHRNKRVMQIDMLIEKQTSADVAFSIEMVNEAGVAVTIPHTVSGPESVPGKPTLCTIKDGVDVFGKTFVTTIRDSSNAHGFNLHGLVFRGYFATHK